MKQFTVLVAPNALKDSATAAEAAAAMSRGLQKSLLKPKIIVMPIADGGDGTLPVLVAALGGKLHYRQVEDPFGRNITAAFGFVQSSGLAIVEMADASGLRLLAPEERNPMKASSLGTGQLIKEAAKAGAREIVLCIGGSATVDGGMGVLHGLGFKFFDTHGALLNPSGDSLVKIASVIPAEFIPRIKILCDVKNHLLGPNGAAAVYGPQKGADNEQVALLEEGLVNWSNLIRHCNNKNVASMTGGGAAGGVSAGLVGWLGAQLLPGAPTVLAWLRAEDAIRQADVVITAEGSIDEQTAEGKAPIALLELAKKYNKPVIAIAGKIPVGLPTGSLAGFDVLLPIGNQPEPLPQAIANTLPNLERTAFQVGNLLAVGLRSPAH